MPEADGLNIDEYWRAAARAAMGVMPGKRKRGFYRQLKRGDFHAILLVQTQMMQTALINQINRDLFKCNPLFNLVIK